MSKTIENKAETQLKLRISQLSRQEVAAFCSLLSLHGASFYTMRDKLMYGTGSFERWEIVGVERMIRSFMPGYDGPLEEFFDRMEEKVRFLQYMADEGGMCRTSCYNRFRPFNFKKWEVAGLLGMLDKFAEEHKQNAEEGV